MPEESKPENLSTEMTGATRSAETARALIRKTKRIVKDFLSCVFSGLSRAQVTISSVRTLPKLVVCVPMNASSITVRMVENFKPLVIRINDIGRAEAVKYDTLGYKPQGRGDQVFPERFLPALLQPQSVYDEGQRQEVVAVPGGPARERRD